MRTTLVISFASDTLGNEICEGHRRSDRYAKSPAPHIGIVKSIAGMVTDDIDMGEAMVLAYLRANEERTQDGANVSGSQADDWKMKR
jgi:hypothetical protein